METIDMGNSCSVVNTYVAELRDVNVQTYALPPQSGAHW